MDAVSVGRALSAREEEMLGLLTGFPDGDGGSDRELSFSDLVDAGARPTSARHDATAPAAQDDHGSTLSPGKREAASKQQREQAAVRERRQRRQRSGGGGGNRGSCGGGGDGVLLNFYVPGLLTRSMTAPRPGRGAGAGQGAPAKAADAVAAGKARASGAGWRCGAAAATAGGRPRSAAEAVGRRDTTEIRRSAQPSGGG